MIFLWFDRGAMRGNSGSRTAAFGPQRNVQKFELYLRLDVEMDAYALPMPFAELN
jgi:hypothetical protein